MLFSLYLFRMAEIKEILRQTQDEINQHKVESNTGMVDVAPRPHVPENVKTWLEKIEESPGMANPISDPDGQPMMKTAAPEDPRIILPTSRENFLEGFAKKMDDAGKWLSTFLLRVIKMKGGKVKFKEE